MAALVVSAIAKWNGSALKKGQKDLTKFQKATNLLQILCRSLCSTQDYPIW